LVKVSTDQEAKDIASAFLQLYREEGWYLERTVHYLARVGMSYVKKQVVDDAHTRAALIARLHLALHNAPDPWLMQPASMVDKKQFTTIMLKEIA
jgi:nitrite reductase (NADH) large subunit